MLLQISLENSFSFELKIEKMFVIITLYILVKSLDLVVAVVSQFVDALPSPSLHVTISAGTLHIT